MKRKSLYIICIIIIVISNFPPINSIITIIERDSGHFCYSRSKDTAYFFSEPGMGPADLSYFSYRIEAIKKHEKPIPLYRNFTKNPLRFWHWKDYFFDERYTLPYISEEDVYKNERERKIKRDSIH